MWKKRVSNFPDEAFVTVSLVYLEHLQGHGIHELRSSVLGGGDHQSLVGVEGESVHALVVELHSLDLGSSLGIVLDDQAVVKSGYYVLIQVGPAKAGGLVEVVHGNLEYGSVQRSVATRHDGAIVSGEFENRYQALLARVEGV